MGISRYSYGQYLYVPFIAVPEWVAHFLPSYCVDLRSHALGVEMSWAVGPAEAPFAGLPPSACAFPVRLPVLISTDGFYVLWFTENFNYIYMVTRKSK